MTVASTPNSDSVRTSRSAVFALVSLARRGAGGRGAEQRAVGKPVLRSARTTSRRRGLDALELRLGLVGDEERRLLGVRAGADDVRDTPPRRRAAGAAARRASAGSETSTSSAVCDSLDGHSNARRAPEPARFTTCPVRRRIAPVEAPVTSRSPPTSSAPPMIAAPVCPMSAASVPPIAIPIKPPESLPSSVMRPRKLTPTPSRNGRTSRRSLRASRSPPSATSATGSTYAASADDLRQHAGEPRADRAAVEPEVEDGREDETEREQREAEELVLVLRARASSSASSRAKGRVAEAAASSSEQPCSADSTRCGALLRAQRCSRE